MSAHRMVKVAAPGTPCGYNGCESGQEAWHVIMVPLPVADRGAALCPFHSPYDVTEADRIVRSMMESHSPSKR